MVISASLTVPVLPKQTEFGWPDRWQREQPKEPPVATPEIPYGIRAHDVLLLPDGVGWFTIILRTNRKGSMAYQCSEIVQIYPVRFAFPCRLFFSAVK